MPLREWIADCQGHAIRVTNTWFHGAKLYIDGDCRDTNSDMIAVFKPGTMSARIDPENLSSPLVEVLIRAVCTVKVKICVDGKQIAGDRF